MVGLLLLLARGVGAEEPFTRVEVRGPVHVVDGDTFEADLNGDGRLDLPRERVRLLYVDTPELSDSWKGKDSRHGLPALAFLESALRGDPVVILVPRERPLDKYGRTLGLARVGRSEINLALVRAGHSHFDTRFGGPPDPADYDAYAEAEGLAFTEGKGIWAEPGSRQRYLARLRQEGKTPRSARNPLYGGGIHDAASLDPLRHLGRFVRVRGRVIAVQPLSHGVVLAELAGRRRDAPLRVVAMRLPAERFAVAAWPPGARVLVEGFVQTYRGEVELALHHARVEPAGAPSR